MPMNHPTSGMTLGVPAKAWENSVKRAPGALVGIGSSTDSQMVFHALLVGRVENESVCWTITHREAGVIGDLDARPEQRAEQSSASTKFLALPRGNQPRAAE